MTWRPRSSVSVWCSSDPEAAQAAMSADRSNATINVANILTLIRLLLVPVFVILLLRHRLNTALLIFCLAGLTDGLDGLIARWFNQRTVLGAYLDPVADKMLLISAFVCLAMLKIIPDWLTVIVLSRDVLILIGIAIFTLAEKKFRIRPSFVSKCTTALQIIMVIVTMMAPDFPGLLPAKYWLVWATAVLTTVSGLHYIYIGMNILQQVEDE
jgi:cardiolipin synthase (CMP-forming)